MLFPHGMSSFMWWWQPSAQNRAQSLCHPSKLQELAVALPLTPLAGTLNGEAVVHQWKSLGQSSLVPSGTSLSEGKKTKHASTTKSIPMDASLL